MQKLNITKPENLSDVFCAVMGGRPDNIREIEEFVKQSPLQKLMYAADIERIVEFNGYFAEETIDAVYALLPIKIPLNETQNWIMTPSSFAKLNNATEAKPASRIINIQFMKAQQIYNQYFPEKVEKVMVTLAEAKFKREERERAERERKEQRRQELELKAREYEEMEKRRQEKQRQEKLEKERQQQEKERLAKEQEEKAAQKREKARLRMRQYRAEHPEKRKSYYKPLDTLSAPERRRQRKANNKRNAVYRAKNKEQIRERHNARRARIKAENPELLKELDRKHNMSAGRKEAGQRYYQKHKEEISQKARQNPMVKVYKRRYQIKKRLEKTGPVISALLQGLIAAKER
ncbi:MAG: hypothetical protein IKR92_00410 [Alphaproteobacteria bacterium]|nr:hypothetical protein [Alphaproteobacteria bacterium]